MFEVACCADEDGQGEMETPTPSSPELDQSPRVEPITSLRQTAFILETVDRSLLANCAYNVGHLRMMDMIVPSSAAAH